MNSRNSKASNHYRLSLSLSNKLNLNRRDKYLA